MERKSKLVSLDEAVAGIEDGMKVATGGWIFNAQPMALIRAVARRGVRGLHLIPAPASIAPDLLIGAGCVASTACVFISFEQFGLAPQFRRAAEAGTIKVHEMDGPGIAGGLRAAACDLPWMPIPDLGTDLPRVNPETYRPMPRKEGERRMLAVPAIKPDVLLLHAQQGDIHGNIQYFGPPFFDWLLAQAAKRVIVSVDRIVDNATIRAGNLLTRLPEAFVHAVVEAPFGAHPTASAGLYAEDEAHLVEYVAASADAAKFAAYLDTYVHGPAGHDGYLERIGRARLEGVKTASDAIVPLAW